GAIQANVDVGHVGAQGHGGIEALDSGLDELQLAGDFGARAYQPFHAGREIGGLGDAVGGADVGAHRHAAGLGEATGLEHAAVDLARLAGIHFHLRRVVPHEDRIFVPDFVVPALERGGVEVEVLAGAPLESQV